MTTQQAQEREDKIDIQILDILREQQYITNQGRNYTGEKDVALNKIKDILSQAIKENNEAIVREIEGLKEKEPEHAGYSKSEGIIYTMVTTKNDVIKRIINLINQR